MRSKFTSKATAAWLFSVHSWTGLINGIWLLILGITGALFVYTVELDQWANQDKLRVQPSSHRLPYDSLVRKVRNQFPAAIGTNIIRFPAGPGESVQFRIYTENNSLPMRDRSQTFFMDLNPYTGEMLRLGNHARISDSLLMWSASFHWNLQLGTVGELIVTLAGILLFVHLITGAVIYRKYIWKVFAFRAPMQWKNWRTTTSGIHRYVGVWSLMFNVLIFFSGLQMTWGVFSEAAWKKSAAIRPYTGTLASVDSMLARTERIFPGFETKYFYIPFSLRPDSDKPGPSVAMGRIPGTPHIIPDSWSQVVFDAASGKTLKTIDANQELSNKGLWDKFLYIAYSFHAGTFAGEISRVIYVAIGLTPSILALTGFMLWWRRKRSPDSVRAAEMKYKKHWINTI